MKSKINLKSIYKINGIGKLLLIMKFCFFFLFLSLLHVSATTLLSQSQTISIQMDDVTIRELVKEIGKQGNINFFYNDNLSELDTKVNVSQKNKPISEVLENALEQANMTYQQIKDNFVVLIPLPEQYKQQSSVVKGTVTDASSNVPLPGVNVIIEGTTQGTITDLNGKYEIDASGSDVVLIFSYIGYVSEKIEVGNQNKIDVSLVPDLKELNEVVVVGYGKIKKYSVTGAVEKAPLKRYSDVPVNNILEGIKGSVAGLNISGINSAGEIGDIIIRGQNSTGASNEPLIVIDDAIFYGSLADIPTSDIENLTVLKDASAAAIYGSRSANGVILIETKRGRGISGKPQFNFGINYGISNELQQLEIYDAEGYIQHLLDYREANDLETNPDNIAIYLQEEEQKNYEATPDHKPTLEDPYDLMDQFAYKTNLNLSISNSTEKSHYYISTSITDQKGVVLNDKYKHFSGRLNIDSDLTDWFNLGIKSSYSLRDYSGSSPNYTAVMFSPYASVYNEDGSYKQYPQTTTSFPSPFWTIATEDKDKRHFLSGIVTGTVKIPWIKGLSYNFTFSNSLSITEINEFYDENTVEGSSKNGIGERTNNQTYNRLFDNIIRYQNTFNYKHNVDLTLLYSREHENWEELYAYGEDFDNTALGTYALENANTQSVSTGGGEANGIGMMARANYTFDQRYSITGTIRRDGYSAFSKNKKWGTFPSVGVNWNISREDFMSSIDFINNLAIRASYGSNGNQSIEPYSTLSKVSTDKYVYYGDASYTLTQYISLMSNENLGWETTTGFNVGIDYAFVDNRIDGSIDLYKTATEDLLFDLEVPKASGFDEVKANIGEIENKGIELCLNTIPVVKKDFRWVSNLVFSLNRNKVVSILGEDYDGDGQEDDLVSSGYFIGKSLETIYDYKVIGMWQQEDLDNNTIMDGMRPGDYKLDDVDGDGSISTESDRQFLGSRKENFRWSWTNTFYYKNFSLMVYLYSIWGGNDWYLSGDNTPYNDAYTNRGDINHPIYDYWTPTNTDAMFPRIDYCNRAAYTGIKYMDRSFIKLQKLSIAYNATDLVDQMGIKGLNIALSADNILTYAPHWEGLDPETEMGLCDEDRPSIRTYMLNLSFNF